MSKVSAGRSCGSSAISPVGSEARYESNIESVQKREIAGGYGKQHVYGAIE